MTEKHTSSNRLIHEKSPYLLQHAHNPVDWYPWGSEAFYKAQKEDKPIFLSIGYATCHWCHVMEKESFENPEVAARMNEAFVNIKVDREELPEVDNLYMEFAQSMMSGSAGWPLNVMLTPNLEPFFASTYLPPHSQPGMMGLVELIERIEEVWSSEEKERVLGQASKIVEVFSQNIHTQGDDLPNKEEPEHLAALLYKLADPVWGGMKGSPKFPIPYQSIFLLRMFYTQKDARSLFLAEVTLDKMQRGGIYDHLGGGFSRYSVDEEWLVPHFEKMLYDNALLMEAYLEAYQITRKPFYRHIVEEIGDYLARDMMSKEGAFYSAEDADSEGEEGKFYTWDKKEVMDLLGKDVGEIFCSYYSILDEGNFEGRNLLHIESREEAFAEKEDLDPSLVQEALDEGKKKLLKARKKRVRPFQDDKILSSWNGLAIHSFALAGYYLGEPRYLALAARAARFIRDHLYKEGRLLRRYRDEEAKHAAGLDEYAFMIRACLTLFEAGEGKEWLDWALEMNQTLGEIFKAQDGAYYQSDGQDSSLLLRKIHYSDGAEPSGNAIQCENLLRLYQMTFEEKYRQQAEDIFRAVKKFSDNYLPGYAYHMINLLRYFHEGPTLVVVSPEDTREDGVEFIKSLIIKEYFPFKSIVFKAPGDTMLSEYVPLEGKTTLYICRRGACERPLVKKEEIREAILKLGETV